MEAINALSQRIEALTFRLEGSRWNIKKLRPKCGPIFVAYLLTEFRDELHLMQSLLDSLILEADKIDARQEPAFNAIGTLILKETRSAAVDYRNELGIEEKRIKRELLSLTTRKEIQN